MDNECQIQKDVPKDVTLKHTEIIDLIGDSAIWTPEIQRLGTSVAKWIRMDLPGGMVWGKQRTGKSWACFYLSAVLTELVGYPVCTVVWSVEAPKRGGIESMRTFIQGRLTDSGCNAISNRDIAILRNRLADHLAGLAVAQNARRVVLIVDEAQNLGVSELCALIDVFNKLEAKKVRPFFLLVGQSELLAIQEDLKSSNAYQVLGRFFTKTHQFKGIKPSEIEQVLMNFDAPIGPEQPSLIEQHFEGAYRDGWRLAQTGPLMRSALESIARNQNISEGLRLPMQYLRSATISMLLDLLDTKQPPGQLDAGKMLAYFGDAGFLDSLLFYAE